jgi:GAF domain-containing protein
VGRKRPSPYPCRQGRTAHRTRAWLDIICCLLSVVIDEAGSDERFAADPYLNLQQPKSIGCIPIITQTHLLGILYLENNLTTHAFTPQRLELLQWLEGFSTMASRSMSSS